MIGMGRLGGYESNYLSDADVLFVYDPPPGVHESTASAAAQAIAEGVAPAAVRARPRPAARCGRRPAPRGPAGPAGTQPRRYAQYYARWSRVWEAQALLRVPVSSAATPTWAPSSRR
ncbi:hypothetical protein [Micromonospora sp. M42]|uniref:hypothetical protein n=1 Tax=Micromonospora sp. M42 TaxID=457406 RepID=UPI000A8249A8